MDRFEVFGRFGSDGWLVERLMSMSSFVSLKRNGTSDELDAEPSLVPTVFKTASPDHTGNWMQMSTQMFRHDH